MSRIYLDHAATTPILPEARAAMADAMARWANPSSPHAEGRAARAALEEARARVKQALRWDGELVFTSGASDALEIALGRTKRRILASPVEHDAVYRAAPGAELLPIGIKGQVDDDGLRAALRVGKPAIAAIQHVNSETGVEQPVDRFSELCREEGSYLLADCSQSAGKIPLPDADLIVVSAHKLGGPPGIGALLVRDYGMLKAVGGQEQGYRPGTQNLPAAMGFAAALERFPMVRTTAGSHPGAFEVVSWLDDMAYGILDLEYPIGQVGGIYQPETNDVTTSAFFCPTIQAISMPGMTAAAQLVRFDSAGIAISVGSACSSGSLKASRALAAFGVPEKDAACTIRVSFGWSTTADDLHRFLQVWLEMAEDVRRRAA